jgi:hypothetical protein
MVHQEAQELQAHAQPAQTAQSAPWLQCAAFTAAAPSATQHCLMATAHFQLLHLHTPTFTSASQVLAATPVAGSRAAQLLTADKPAHFMHSNA